MYSMNIFTGELAIPQNAKNIKITIWGAGGGGGGGSEYSKLLGGGGGAGGYSLVNYPIDKPQIISVISGAGGKGGNIERDGHRGDDTIVIIGEMILRVPGGYGGRGAINTTGAGGINPPSNTYEAGRNGGDGGAGGINTRSGRGAGGAGGGGGYGPVRIGGMGGRGIPRMFGEDEANGGTVLTGGGGGGGASNGRGGSGGRGGAFITYDV